MRQRKYVPFTQFNDGLGATPPDKRNGDMKRTGRYVVMALLVVVLMTGAYLGGRNEPVLLRVIGGQRLQAQALSGGDDAAQFDLLFEVLRLVRRNYVEPIPDKDNKKLVYGAIRGMLRSLDDQYTRFMDPASYTNMTIETKGAFGGVGIVIGIRNEQLTVISPLEGTPAYKAGLKSGDIIIKIDETSTEDMALDDAVSRIRGEKGSKVKLTIWRPGFPRDGKEYSLTRDTIELKPINNKKIIGGIIGYVKLDTFSENSAPSLRDTLLDFKAKHVKAIILDLRNNPGGLLESAIDVANLFVDEGPIVFRQSRDRQPVGYWARSGQRVVNLPMAVLVNQYSASASEIVSGCLQDDKVATLIGEKTFGKGLVQTIFHLSDDSAVLITTDKYMTAKMRDINKKGIMPDIVVKEDSVDMHEANSESESGPSDRVGHFPLKKGPKVKLPANAGGLIFEGMPRDDLYYIKVGGKKYLEVDDVAKLFGVTAAMDKPSGRLDIETDRSKLKSLNEKDIQLDKAVEFLKKKIAGK